MRVRPLQRLRSKAIRMEFGRDGGKQKAFSVFDYVHQPVSDTEELALEYLDIEI